MSDLRCADLRHKDPPFFEEPLFQDKGFPQRLRPQGTWELEVGGAGGAGARLFFLHPRGAFTTGLPSHREGVSLGASAATRRRAWEVPAGGASLLPRVKKPRQTKGSAPRAAYHTKLLLFTVLKK